MLIRRSLYLRSCVHDRLAVRPVAVAALFPRFIRSGRSRLYGSLASADTLPLQEQEQTSKSLILGIKVRPESARDKSIVSNDVPGDGGRTAGADAPMSAETAGKQNLTAQHLEEIFNIKNLKEIDIDELLSPLGPRSITSVTHIKVRNKVHWAHLYTQLLSARVTDSALDQDLFADEKVLATFFSLDLDSSQFREKFHSLNITSRLKIVPSLLIGSLVQSPKRCLFILDNLGPKYVHLRRRMQCLRHLHHAYASEIRESPDLMLTYETQLKQCSSPKTWGTASITGPLLKLLLKYLDTEQCESLIQEYMAIYTHARHEELLVILEYYIFKGDVNNALELFRKLPSELLQSPDTKIMQLRDQLLRLDTVVKTEVGSTFKILPELLAMGFKADGDVHNIVMRRAIAQGMSNVAWDLYHYLRQEGLDISHLTYLDLLRDSFKSGHTRAVNDIMTAIYQNQSLVQSPYLVAYSMNIVRIVSFHHSDSTPSEAFARIMTLYDRVWSREALKPFDILDASQTVPSVEKSAQPHPMSLAFTLWSYILVQRSERVVDLLWKRIIHLADQGNEIVLDLLKHDVVYNAFVLFNARKLDRVMNALQVLQYMMEKKFCLPTARTWSMLTCAFLRHGQFEQAASTARLMTAHGLSLESISGEHLPEGYSLQDLGKVVEEELNEQQMPVSLESLQAELASDAFQLENSIDLADL